MNPMSMQILKTKIITLIITSLCLLLRNNFFEVKTLPAMRFLRADTHGVVKYDLQMNDQILSEVAGAGQDGMVDMTPATDAWVETELTRLMKHMRDHNWISKE